MKREYWSNTKFADWVRGTPKPFAATPEEWADWHNDAKKRKFRYWLAEEGLDYLQSIVYWPANRAYDIYCYIQNRWISKSHTLTSYLKKGQWHDFDTRLLYSAFDELVNFVEIEQAWLNYTSDENNHKYVKPWYRRLLRLESWRSPELGIAYLNWASELKHDEDWLDKDDPDYGTPTSQAIAAQETLVLYRWWKEERPKRPDPYIASGIEQYYQLKQKSDPTFDKLSPLEKFKDDNFRKMSKYYQKIENDYQEEDTAMLIRLVKLRDKLWT